MADMFEGSAAQFLCILESLTDTNRRILLTAPPASDSEVEILDVYAELFMAGQEILAGLSSHTDFLSNIPLFEYHSTYIKHFLRILFSRSITGDWGLCGSLTVCLFGYSLSWSVCVLQGAEVTGGHPSSQPVVSTSQPWLE